MDLLYVWCMQILKVAEFSDDGPVIPYLKAFTYWEPGIFCSHIDLKVARV